MLTKKPVGWDWMIYDPIIAPNVDIIHTFNHVCDVPIPWVASFESTIPRTNQTVGRRWERSLFFLKPDEFTRRSLELLEKDNCKALIAISESARRIQNNMLDHMDFSGLDVIKKKILVLHPPQEILIDAEAVMKKYENPVLEFVFVGRDFFRKGCDKFIEVLQEFSHVADFHLTVVSELGMLNFADESAKQIWENKLNNTPWITWYKNLRNKECLELFRRSHIGILTTLQDTYGYSTLEMQACGCPVITTDIRACPEINNNSCGWMVHLEKDSIGGESLRGTPEEIEKCEFALKDGIRGSLKQIFESPLEKLQAKAFRSIERIKKEHDPQEYAMHLKRIYSFIE